MRSPKEICIRSIFPHWSTTDDTHNTYLYHRWNDKTHKSTLSTISGAINTNAVYFLNVEMH